MELLHYFRELYISDYLMLLVYLSTHPESLEVFHILVGLISEQDLLRMFFYQFQYPQFS